MLFCNSGTDNKGEAKRDARYNVVKDKIQDTKYVTDQVQVRVPCMSLFLNSKRGGGMVSGTQNLRP